MIYNNIQLSGFSFDESEANLEFKFKILNSIILIAIVFAFLFWLLHDLGIINIGIQSKVDYVYSLSTFGLMLYLRNSKRLYTRSATIKALEQAKEAT